MNINKILLVLITISFIVLAFALKNRTDLIKENIKNLEIEKNISSTSTVRKTEENKIQEDKFYTIQKGDTLWDIAEKNYGSGFMYKKIIENNPGKTFTFADGRAGLIYEGTVLKL